MARNRLFLSAPGSGKTTLICDEVLSAYSHNRILITTYTDSNADEIRKKLAKKHGAVPSNVTILPWFAFLLRHGVRPYQGSMEPGLRHRRIGFFLSSERSGYRARNSYGTPIYWGENNFYKYYFTDDLKIYSDKISKFVYVCNKDKVQGEIISRIARLFDRIYIDEVQDLAGWDLEIIKLLSKTRASVTLVGDPRQTIYLTNHAPKHAKYRDGKIQLFLTEKCKSLNYTIDTSTLRRSHRNNQQICDFSSLLYPNYDTTEECSCIECSHANDHQGIFLIKSKDVDRYLESYPDCQILRNSGSSGTELNYGVSKGRTFDRILIHPTEPIRNYIRTGDLGVFSSSVPVARFYVALTRARHSVAIVYDYRDDEALPSDQLHMWR